MSAMRLHVVSISRAWLGLVPFLAVCAWAVRPDALAKALPPEQVTLNLVPSGLAQRVTSIDQGLVEEFKHDIEKDGRNDVMGVGSLAEVAATQSSESGPQRSKQQVVACNDIARLAMLASHYTSFLQVFSPKPLHKHKHHDKSTVEKAEKEMKEVLKENVVTIQGKQYVTEKKCESAADVLTNLLDQQRHVEVIAMVGAVVATLVALVMLSLFIGMGLKPPAPRYWKNRPWCFSFSNHFQDEVDVTAELGPVIQKLIDFTTEPEKMGVPGLDGHWQTHKAMKVQKVLRCENGHTWTQFAHARKFTLPFMQNVQEMPQELRKHTEESWATVRKAYGAREADPDIANFLQGLELDELRNEVMLFHGSPMKGGRNSKGEEIFHTEHQSPLHAIKHQGFDERLGNVKGRLGSGTYFADQASKADNYAGRYHEWADGKDPGSVGEVAAMYLCRVVLGCPYVTSQSLEQLRRPPCQQGHFDFQLDFSEVCTGKQWSAKGLELDVCNHNRCESVISDFAPDVDKNYREYVLYEKRCYPEYLIIYERQ